ncbi:hypothetical protein CMU93_17965, partial [Elizabethkingia anophelis]|nr:hypothetical protein [Elizabethkingia anophelis]
MKSKSRQISILGVLFLPVIVFAQKDSLATQDTIKRTIDKIKTTSLKEDGNRNVMLNAANNTSPRDVNIGLPASV